MVPKSHSIPQQTAITRLICLPVPVLSNYILDRIELTATVVRIYHDLLAAEDLLFATVHEMILMYTILLPLVIILLL